jgi:hypothetical protein
MTASSMPALIAICSRGASSATFAVFTAVAPSPSRPRPSNSPPRPAAGPHHCRRRCPSPPRPYRCGQRFDAVLGRGRAHRRRTIGAPATGRVLQLQSDLLTSPPGQDPVSPARHRRDMRTASCTGHRSRAGLRSAPSGAVARARRLDRASPHLQYSDRIVQVLAGSPDRSTGGSRTPPIVR